MQKIEPGTLIPVPQTLVQTAKRRGDHPAYWSEIDGTWHAQSWAALAADVDAVGRALVALDVTPGQIICILGRNRAEWPIMAHGAMAAGCSPAGIYFTSSPDEIEYIVNHSECPVILCDTDAHLDRVQTIRNATPSLRHVVSMNRDTQVDGVMSWGNFLGKGTPEHQPALDARRAALTLTDTALLVYTSGTTGLPKAVVISHRAAAWVPPALGTVMELHETERMLSYLPLAHIAEFVNTVLSPVVFGYHIWFCRDPLQMPEVLPICRPTVFFGVPRVWQKIEERIAQRLATATGAKASLARWALKVGQAAAIKRLDKEAVPFALRLQHKLADRVILSKIRAALGLETCRIPISASAPISVRTLQFIGGLGVDVYEGYGLSETCAPVSFNAAGATRLGTVGRPVEGVEVKIAEDDEVLVRGPNLLDGYLKDAKATAEALTEDGWFRTGDLGKLDRDGYLSIIGRKKEILITAGGKNISPGKIENDLMSAAPIEHAMLLGDGERFIGALITVSPDWLEAFALAEGLKDAGPHHPRVHAEVTAAIAEINPHYARVNQVHGFRILDAPFTQEADELTPTLKMKRKTIMANHAATIEALYAPNDRKDHP